MPKKSDWDLAIQDFKEMIGVLEKKITRLRESIHVFEQSRDNGRPWPGNKEIEVQKRVADSA